MDPITAQHVLDEIRDMRRENREDFNQVRLQIDGLVAKPECEVCKVQWREALMNKVDKRYFLGWGAAFVFVVALIGLATKV